jgi:hypothetical protein
MLQRADRADPADRSVDAEEVDFCFEVSDRARSLIRADLTTSHPATMFERRTFRGGDTICVAGDAATCVCSGCGEVERSSGSDAVSRHERFDVVGEYGMFRPEGRRPPWWPRHDDRARARLHALQEVPMAFRSPVALMTGLSVAFRIGKRLTRMEH